MKLKKMDREEAGSEYLDPPLTVIVGLWYRFCYHNGGIFVPQQQISWIDIVDIFVHSLKKIQQKL